MSLMFIFIEIMELNYDICKLHDLKNILIYLFLKRVIMNLYVSKYIQKILNITYYQNCTT